MKTVGTTTQACRFGWALSIAAAILPLAAAPAGAQTTTALTDRTWVSMTNGYGPVELNRSNGENQPGDGAPLTLNGTTYAKGLGTHAPSEVKYALDGSCTTLTGVVGVDDEVGDNGSVVFQVFADGVQKYDSGAMTGAMAGKNMSVDITGARELSLQVGDGGWTDYDHADWANLQITCGSGGGATTSLTDRVWTSATNGYGPVEVNKSNGESGAGDGSTLAIEGVAHAKGLGVHANSDVRYALVGSCSLFTTVVGVDDEVGGNGSMVFQVWTDGVKKYDSGLMTGAMAGKNVSVDVSGATQLALIATDAGNGVDYDHGDWATPELTCSSTITPTPPSGTGPASASAVRVIPPGEAPATPTVTVTPATATITAGGQQQFSASVTGTANTSVTWTASGGNVTAGGAYTAPSAAGTYTVVATITGGTITRSATVTVQAAPTQPPPSGIPISPGQDIQAAVNANPTGTAFVIKAGVHRMHTIRPKDGNRFTGEPGAVISGARLLTSFTRSGSYWVASGQTQQGQVHGECQVAFPRCNYAEQLFIDDTPLLHVGSLSQVTPGKWYFDYGADQIYLADDPAGRRVETSVTTTAFEATGNNVTISGLTIEKYANIAQFGAIHPEGKTGWVIANNEVRWNHGVGVRTGTGAKVTGNNVHHNGQLGIGGVGSDVLVEGNEIAYNNAAGFNYGWEGGGTKFVATSRLTLRSNFAHHNNGPGLWLDIDNIDFLLEGNRADDNYATVSAAAPGIMIEISYGGIIRNNTARRNGAGFSAWIWSAGILVAASGGAGLEIYGNTVEDNEHGIAVVQQSRGSGRYGPYLVQNVNVHDNTIKMPRGMTGAAQDVGDDGVFTSRNIRFERNNYNLAGGGHFAWMNGERSDAQWRGYGMDTTGTFVK
jgi:hypothetical protein